LSPPASPRIYLDHAATSPLRPEVRERLQELVAEVRGNPSSPHAEGREARRLLETARRRAAQLLGVPTSWVIFTRGGTESNNLAVLGCGRVRPGAAILHSSLEHSAVREAGALLAQEGHPLHLLPVNGRGEVDSELLEARLSGPHPVALLSLQAVHSETGLALQLEPALALAAERGVPVHVDAVQGVGRVNLPPLSEGGGHGVRLLSLSAHKLGGPVGVGILVRDPTLPLAPLLAGGRQEGGLRPGTEDVVGAVAGVEALELALSGWEAEAVRLRGLRDHLESTLLEGLPALRALGSEGERAPHISLLALSGLPRDLLPSALDMEGIAASAGSACRSGTTEASPALRALVGPEAELLAPLRLSLGWSTTEAEVLEAQERILRVLQRVGASPAVS
jgi:cysteine desulfurase